MGGVARWLTLLVKCNAQLSTEAECAIVSGGGLGLVSVILRNKIMVDSFLVRAEMFLFIYRC